MACLRISSASSANTSNEIGWVRYTLEQLACKTLIVGQSDLVHQRRIGREAGDTRIRGQRKDAVEIGAVGEYSCRDLIEHDEPPRNVHHNVTEFKPIVSDVRASIRSTAFGEVLGDASRGQPPANACERCRDGGSADVLQPAGFAGGDIGVGVSDHPRDIARSIAEAAGARPAAFPGPACDSRMARVSSGTTPCSWCMHRRERRQHHALLAEQLRAPGRAPRATARRETLPFAAAGWFETHTSANPSRASAAAAAAAPGIRRTSSTLSGDSGVPESGIRDQLVQHAVSIEEYRGTTGGRLIGP